MSEPSEAALAARDTVLLLEDRLRRERSNLALVQASHQAPASAHARIRGMIRKTQIELGKARLIATNVEMGIAR